MSLSLEEVEHIADLARLELTKQEKERFRDQLSKVLDYIAHLQELDTQEIQPTSSVLPAGSILRADEPQSSLSRHELLANAPLVEDDQFQVPPVLD